MTITVNNPISATGTAAAGADQSVQYNNALVLGGASKLDWDDAAGALKPHANDGAVLGTATLSFSDIFLAEGGVINWDNGDATITQAGNNITVAGTTSLTYNTGQDNPIVLQGSGSGYSEINFKSGQRLIAGATADGTMYIDVPTGGEIHYRINSADKLSIALNDMHPGTNDDMALGTTSNNWSDLFLASGAVINFNNGDVTLTHGSDVLTVAGGGITLAAGTTGIAPIKFTSGTNLTTATAGAFEYDGKAIYGTTVASARQVINAEQISILTADRTGTNLASAQAIFGSTEDVIALAASTTYQFESLLQLVRSTGTTSHTTTILYALAGGSITSMDFLVQAAMATGSALGAVSQIMSTSQTGVVATAANTTANENSHFWIRGVIRMNASGTITPQFQYSATPGGAPQIKRGSYFRCWPIGTDTVASVGNWS